MAYFALIATDPQDHERVSIDLQAVLATYGPTATASVVQAPTSQPATVPATVEVTTSQPSQPVAAEVVGSDPAANARNARAFYRDVAHRIGQTTLTPEQKGYAKAQRGQGADSATVAASLAGSQPAPQPAAQPEPTDPIAQLEQQLAAMKAQLANAGQPASQPAAPKAQTRVKHESIPASATLSQAVCNELQTWAMSLTGDMATGRKGAVVAYATGQPDGIARVTSAYGTKLPKFLRKLDELVNA